MEIELACYEHDLCLKTLQNATFQTIEHKLSTLSLPIYFLGTARQYIEGFKTKLATVIDGPFGFGTLETRQSAIMFAVRKGAQIIELAMPYSVYRDEKWGELKADIKSALELCKSKNVSLRVILEYRLFSIEELLILTEFYQKFGLETVISSAGGFMDDYLDNVTVCELINKKRDLRMIPASNGWKQNSFDSIKYNHTNTVRIISLPLFSRIFAN